MRTRKADIPACRVDQVPKAAAQQLTQARIRASSQPQPRGFLVLRTWRARRAVANLLAASIFDKKAV